MDNPIAFANLIINDILFASGQIKEALPILNVDQYKEMGYVFDQVDYIGNFEGENNQPQEEFKEEVMISEN